MAEGNKPKRKSQKSSGPKYLYHYTDRQGIEGVLRTQKLRASTNRTDDATYGQGTYFTELGPKSDAQWLKTNNWGDISRRIPDDRVKYYVKVPRDQMPMDRLQNYSRNEDGRVFSVWVHEGTKPMDLKSVGASYGRRTPGVKPKEVTLDNLTYDEEDSGANATANAQKVRDGNSRDTQSWISRWFKG